MCVRTTNLQGRGADDRKAPMPYRRSATLRRRASSAASANSQFRNVTIFGRFDVAFGQTIQ